MITDNPSHTHRELALGWGIPMAMGILLVIGGAFALSASVLTSFISVLYLGALLVIAGIVELVAAFRMRRSQPYFAYVLAGVLTLVVGGLFLSRPLATIVSLSLLIAGYLFASGLFRAVTALSERYTRWGWDFAYALVAVTLGSYLIAAWPIDSLWILGTLVAIEIIARGATLIAAAWVLRDISGGRSASAPPASASPGHA